MSKPCFCFLITERTRINKGSEEPLTQGIAANHVKHTARGAYNNLHTILQLGDIGGHIGSTDAGHAGGLQVVSKSNEDLLDLNIHNKLKLPD